jgi:hypothetical protein
VSEFTCAQDGSNKIFRLFKGDNRVPRNTLHPTQLRLLATLWPQRIPPGPREDPRYRSRPGNGGRLKRSPGNQPLVYVGVEQELEYDQIKLLVPINSNTFNGRIVGP